MKLSSIHALHLITAFALAFTAVQRAQARQPNVIFILADDLGIGDLSCYGQDKFETPNIDKLAKQGMSLTNHYSGSTVCAPSRCALLTGRHMGNAAVRGNAELAPEGQEPMPADTYTAAHHFKKAGYATGVFGKWGLGAAESTSDPMRMGFDDFYGYNCQRQAHCYYPAWLWRDNEREFLWGNEGSFKTVYAPELIHQEALDFIRTNKDKPFYMYYALVQPHADMIAPERYMKKYRGKYLPEFSYEEDYYIGQPEGHAAFVAMVDILDEYVGDVMAELEELGIADDTLVIFTSDNGAHEEGGADPEYFDSNGVYKGFKRDLYEGGIHVPMIAVWPGRIRAGSSDAHISAFWDFLPTVADLTDMPLPVAVDGVSYLPTLLGRDDQPAHDYLYWEFAMKGGRKAIRKGQWKGVRYGALKHPDSALELYDLDNDPGETVNLANKFPEIVAELDYLMSEARTDARLEKWNFKPKKQ
ncbi:MULTISPECIES: arylsulfatase [unclassified Lentimonas]|uniref:arylsulfatase n=1 Tax=unclassified Lentimonas TaxID=2630993 RepID=UPI001325CD93|nr:MULTISPECIES: arylsulfatase [unclassified Lentimonas]CAA6692399.1 Choline-sulfatase (EC [Lentimonas sp. CC19]CAA6693974.1 Choline-sulfatase (EC [Lentimonas sp. CC10]CAA7072217.1 Choline-sulfatase (EC [Lentimonas sp. CC11]